LSALINRCRQLILLLLALPIGATAAVASDFNAIATLTSEYIYRGLAQSNGNPALQFGVDYEHDSGLFVGAWASTIDLTSRFGQRDLELDYYAGYHYVPDAPWQASLTLVRYTYPGETGAHSYAYNELLLAASVADHWFVEFGYANNYYDLERIARHWEVRTEWPISGAWMFGAALGGNDLSDLNTPHYLYWDVGASARVSRFTFDLRWHDNQPAGGLATSISTGSQLVFSVSAAL
jgi:uncharacterized protein (TIGR02001 family)